MSPGSADFLDSSPFLDKEGDVLEHRLKKDSYLFFRKLLDPGCILELRAEILESLASIGWLAENTDPNEALPGPIPHFSPGRYNNEPAVDKVWYSGYKLIQSLEKFHKLAHHPILCELMGRLLGADLIIHPRKIARVSFPNIEYPTPPHQDFNFNEASPDVLTTWIPLGSISRQSNGLQILRGSASRGPLEAYPADGVGGERVDVDDNSPDWTAASYEPGDVLVFHCFTVHRAPPNTGDRLRLSVDYRYQSASNPLKPDTLQPHGYGRGLMPSWKKLSSGWTSLSWIEVPYPVRIVHSGGSQAPVSRLT